MNDPYQNLSGYPLYLLRHLVLQKDAVPIRARITCLESFKI